MIQAKFRLDSDLTDFLNHHLAYGFKDKSSVVREALVRLKHELEQQALEDSAALYTEQYVADTDLRDLTETAIGEWPQ